MAVSRPSVLFYIPRAIHALWGALPPSQFPFFSTKTVVLFFPRYGFFALASIPSLYRAVRMYVLGARLRRLQMKEPRRLGPDGLVYLTHLLYFFQAMAA